MFLKVSDLFFQDVKGRTTKRKHMVSPPEDAEMELKILEENELRSLVYLALFFSVYFSLIFPLRMLKHLGISWQLKFYRGEFWNKYCQNREISGFSDIFLKLLQALYYCASNILGDLSRRHRRHLEIAT